MEPSEPGRAKVTVRCYAELNDFLPPDRRNRSFETTVEAHQTVKDVVEALGIPHTEIDLVLVDGTPVGFVDRPPPGSRMSVYPVFETLDVGPVNRLRPEPLRHPRFVLDVHLGRLARNLRLLGFDTAWAADHDDAELADQSATEHRILLTRDVGLLKRAAVRHGAWIRATDPDQQTIEVLDRFDLRARARPFTRCLRCNGELEDVAKEDIAHRLPPATRREHHHFRRCRSCGQLYWPGSHRGVLAERVERWLDQGVVRDLGPEPS